MERSWLAKHGGTVLPDGSIVASPSGVNSCLSSLSTGFSLLGRGGGWSPVTLHGNPMHSAVLVHWRKGYKLQSWRRGCQETSAVPMTSNKAFELVDYVDSVAAASSNVMEVLLCQRDALIVLLMWESCLRGVDCGKLRVEDTLEGSSAQLPLPEPILIASQIIIRPHGSKTVKGSRAGAITLEQTDNEAHCSLSWMMKYLRARSAASMGVDSYKFSPSLRNGCGFATAAFSSSSIGKRLHKHLVAGGLYQGESNHGYRRGRMQEYAAEGLELAIGKLAQIKTLAIVERYLDVSRHEARHSQAQKRKFAVVD